MATARAGQVTRERETLKEDPVALKDMVNIPVLFGGKDHTGHSSVISCVHLTYINSVILTCQKRNII